MTGLPTTPLGNTLVDLLQSYEQLLDNVQDLNFFELHTDQLFPANPENIADYQRENHLAIPEDVKVFWMSGVRIGDWQDNAGDESTCGGGSDFLDHKQVVRNTNLLRDLAKIYKSEHTELKRIHTYGIPLSFSEPNFILDGQPNRTINGVHRMLYDGDPISDPVANSFTIFFEHWLATGCFSYGDFETYWQEIKSIVPLKIPLRENLWLKFWDKQYNTQYSL